MKHDVIIVGHALAGLSCALCLVDKNPSHNVALVGPVPSFITPKDKPGRQVALNEASLFLLDNLGLLGALKAQDIEYYDRMRVWDSGSNAVIEFTAAEVARENLGAIVSVNALLKEMSNRLGSCGNITFYPQQALACQKQASGWKVKLSEETFTSSKP